MDQRPVVDDDLVADQALEAVLTDEEYRNLQMVLANRPYMGALIQHSGGLRKARWALAGKGKRGGVRIIYYWAVAQLGLASNDSATVAFTAWMPPTVVALGAKSLSV